MFRRRTLLAIVSLLLVIFILAIVISPVVDIPVAGLRTQALVLAFFVAIVSATQMCSGILRNQAFIRTLFPFNTAPEISFQPGAVLLC